MVHQRGRVKESEEENKEDGEEEGDKEDEDELEGLSGLSAMVRGKCPAKSCWLHSSSTQFPVI